MIAEEKQDDLSMEDILSSIKDILNNETQDGGNTASRPETETQAQPQTTPSPVNDEKSEDDDVFDLSKDMIIDDKDFADLNLNAENLDIDLGDLAKESAEINLNDFAAEVDAADNVLDLSPTAGTSETEAEAVPDFAIPEIEDLPSLDDLTSLDFTDNEDIKLEPEAEKIIPAAEIKPEPVKETIVEAEPETAVEPEETVLETEDNSEAEIELPAPEPIELLDDRSDAPFLSAVDETEAEPIFSAEDDVIADETPAVEAIADENDETPSEVDSSNIDAILSTASEAIEADAPAAEDSDAVDASADIINNFARMFAGKNEEVKAEPAAAPAAVTAVDDKAPLGDGSKTIEQVVQDVIRQIIGETVSAKFSAGVDLDAYAREEIKNQTKAWLDKNLTAVVEAAVQKEIQRVMAKVGK